MLPVPTAVGLVESTTRVGSALVTVTGTLFAGAGPPRYPVRPIWRALPTGASPTWIAGVGPTLIVAVTGATRGGLACRGAVPTETPGTAIFSDVLPCAAVTAGSPAAT